MVAVRLISKSAFNICTAVGSAHGVIYRMFSRTELKLEDAFVANLWEFEVFFSAVSGCGGEIVIISHSLSSDN